MVVAAADHPVARHPEESQDWYRQVEDYHQGDKHKQSVEIEIDVFQQLHGRSPFLSSF